MQCAGCHGMKGGFQLVWRRPETTYRGFSGPEFIPADFADRPRRFMGAGGVSTPYAKVVGARNGSRNTGLASKFFADIDIPDLPTDTTSATEALADAVSNVPAEVTADVIVETGKTYYAKGFDEGKSNGMLYGALGGAAILWLIMR